MLQKFMEILFSKHVAYSKDVEVQDFDYIVGMLIVCNEMSNIFAVGAGCSGCVIARRLSDAGFKVALVEAGKADSWWKLHVPSMFRNVMNSDHDWEYLTVPQEGLDGRKICINSGKVVGGTSQMNLMIAARGVSGDFESWATKHGCEEWAWKKICHLYEKLESFASVGKNSSRGRDGQLSVEQLPHLSSEAAHWIKSCQTLGLDYVDDYNNDDLQNCVSKAQFTSKHGLRQAASVFLKNSEVELFESSEVTKVIFDAKIRAIGVEFLSIDGNKRNIRARKEIILCAGAIGSPLLLMKSGIGPLNVLKDAGIPCLVQNEVVGSHLQDHVMLPLFFSSNGERVAEEEKTTWLNAITLKIFGKGPFSRNGIEAIAYFKGIWQVLARFNSASSFAFFPNILHPKSEGRVVVQVDGKPYIDPRFLSDPQDVRELLEAAQFCVKSCQDFQVELSEGPLTEEFVRKKATTIWHVAGSCRMSEDVTDSVVDSKCRVRGTLSLRVADASIMPSLPTGNTQLPVYLIGEKLSEMILQDSTPNLIA